MKTQLDRLREIMRQSKADGVLMRYYPARGIYLLYAPKNELERYIQHLPVPQNHITPRYTAL